MRYPWRQGRGKRAVGVGVPGDVDGTPREAGADPPVTGPVCAGGGVAGNPAADAHATRLSGPGARAGPDVARAAPVGGPGKGRAPVPVRAAERPCVPVTAVSGDATAGHVPREMSHDPGEDRAAGIHRVLLPAVAVQVRGVGRQEVQPDAAVGSLQEGFQRLRVMVAGVVQEDVDHPAAGVVALQSQRPQGRAGVDPFAPAHGEPHRLQVQRPVQEAPPSRGGPDRGPVRPEEPAVSGPAPPFGMDRVREDDRRWPARPASAVRISA